jgi:hypothetical protein
MRGFWLVWVVAGLGATVGAVLGLLAGAWEIPERGRIVVAGILAGCLLGLLGGVLFGVLFAASDDPPFDGKEEIGARRVGIYFGVPAGSLLGGIMGFGGGLVRQGKGRGC